jgi:type IV secretory pathway VirB2 component (pilin)
MNKWLATILPMALKMASPQMVATLRAFVAEQVKKAEATSNPWDDILWFFIQTIVGEPGATVEPESAE